MVTIERKYEKDGDIILCLAIPEQERESFKKSLQQRFPDIELGEDDLVRASKEKQNDLRKFIDDFNNK